jgi:DNA sulfur modification protein DndB
LRKEFIHSHAIALAALGRVGQSLLVADQRHWKSSLRALRELDWSRSNSRLWEGRAMIAGRLSKANSCVVLTANAIKQHLGLELTADEQVLERQFKRAERADQAAPWNLCLRCQARCFGSGHAVSFLRQSQSFAVVFPSGF